MSSLKRYVVDFSIRAALLLVCLLVTLLSTIGAIVNLFRSPSISWLTLISFDQLANTCLPGLLGTLFGVKKGDPGFGNPDETVSGVLGKLYEAGAGNRLAEIVHGILNRIEAHHCELSIERDEVTVSND